MSEPALIERHRTAIRRPSYSLPVKCLLRDGLLDPSATLFDYGCGRGQDLDLLQSLGCSCAGWDPAHRPLAPKHEADVVNLGYVINVIEDPQERRAALAQAWALARRLLVVAAQTELAAPAKEYALLNDGIITSRKTFQKYYTQAELRTYLEDQLGADAIPAAPGIFYLFRQEAAKQEFLARRYHSRIAIPVRRATEVLFENNRDVLDPFMETLTRLGRLPGEQECSQSVEIVHRFGSLRRALALVQRVTHAAPWQAIAERRAQDLLVYLALARFHRRPVFSRLPLGIQLDVKAFYGNYQRACQTADQLLFQAGNAAAVDEACRTSPTGLLVRNALLIHRSALDEIAPLLRVYEGCARALVGDVEAANVIKLHRFSSKVSYLSYPSFEDEAHPAPHQRIKVNLRNLWIDFFDHSADPDPPILHRKESLLPADHPLRERFARLTRQEEARGLLAQPDLVETRQRWQASLRAAGLETRGHRLFRCKPTGS